MGGENEIMCDSHHSMRGRPRHALGFGMMPGIFGFSDCWSDFESKETAIKRLEAFKSHLEDTIKNIDERIAELQTPGEGEEV
ncbi:MAG: hypothetical protein ACFFEU_10680 [Candidatus Thorarchaeota archaeon]|jgi:hypothetical protein